MGLGINSVGIPEISPYTKSEQPRVEGKHLFPRYAKSGYAAVAADIFSQKISISKRSENCSYQSRLIPTYGHADPPPRKISPHFFFLIKNLKKNRKIVHFFFN